MALMDAVRYASTLTQSVVVAVSLGKDSIAMLDLCCKNFRYVYPYFMYVVKGLEFQETYIRYIEKRYNVEMLRVPHFMLGVMYLAGMFRDTNRFTNECPRITPNDVVEYVRNYFNCEWVAFGEMICESISRNAMLKGIDGVDTMRKKIYPLAEWNPKKVKSYLEMHKIQLSPEYRYCKRSIGDLRPENLDVLKEHFPNDYARVKEVFPYIEAHEQRKMFENALKMAEAEYERELEEEYNNQQRGIENGE